MRIFAWLLVIVAVVLQGCYSFSTENRLTHLHTIAVPIFNDHSGAGIAQSRSELTKALIDRLERESALRLIPSLSLADALLEGTLVAYSDVPAQLSATTGRAATNRITLIVQVELEERSTHELLFSERFVGSAEYAIGNMVAQQEARRRAQHQIAESIADRIISGW
uniref:Lipoprotein n=1 Tax=Chlorobium chlorochromatii (strain CaD3) TaxID=340177 RepID=Q3AQ35_CHLCH